MANTSIKIFLVFLKEPRLAFLKIKGLTISLFIRERSG
jgi:hypothetical protein